MQVPVKAAEGRYLLCSDQAKIHVISRCLWLLSPQQLLLLLLQMTCNSPSTLSAQSVFLSAAQTNIQTVKARAAFHVPVAMFL